MTLGVAGRRRERPGHQFPPATEGYRRAVVLRRDELASNRSVGAAQAAYYLATGVAPFAGRRAFEAVTGRKREWWLVLTVGAIVSVVGASLASAVANDRVTPEVRLLGVGSAASLGGIDVVYVLKGRIAPTYLVDAAVQAAILAAWVRAGRTET